MQDESLLDLGKVERSHYDHQISLVPLINLSNKGFKTVYKDWEDHLRKSFANAKHLLHCYRVEIPIMIICHMFKEKWLYLFWLNNTHY